MPWKKPISPFCFIFGHFLSWSKINQEPKIGSLLAKDQTFHQKWRSASGEIIWTKVKNFKLNQTWSKIGSWLTKVHITRSDCECGIWTKVKSFWSKVILDCLYIDIFCPEFLPWYKLFVAENDNVAQVVIVDIGSPQRHHQVPEVDFLYSKSGFVVYPIKVDFFSFKIAFLMETWGPRVGYLPLQILQQWCARRT